MKIQKRHAYFISIFSLAVLNALFISSCDQPQDLPAKKPNLVFILIDDLGWADLPSYGNLFNEAPNIEKLRSEGMKFTNAYSASPVCSPARAALLSGQYPARLGINDFIPGHKRPFEKLKVPVNKTQYLPTEITTFGEHMQRGGYKTGYFGKWHLGWSGDVLPNGQGFDSAVVFNGWTHFNIANSLQPKEISLPDSTYLTNYLTDQTLGFIEKNKDEPFAVVLSHYAVHIPLQAKEQLIAKYTNKPKVSGYVSNPTYAAMIEHVDASVGEVVKKLKDLGLEENTIIIVYSDNGGLIERYDKANGVIVTDNKPLRGEKGTLYEGGIREPLIIKWPGVVNSGSESDAVVTGVDLYPTFLDMLGVNSFGKLDGESIVPLLTGNKKERDKRAVFWHYPVYHHDRPAGAVRLGKYKLIEHYDTGEISLFDLESDIGENNNLENKLPDKRNQLHNMLIQWRDSVNAAMPVPNPNYNADRAHEWG